MNMKVQDIIDYFEQDIPAALAMDWDNVGLLVGDRSAEVHKIYVALDVTDEVIDHAIAADADMIVSHHPMIFSSVSSVVADDFIGARIMKLIQNGIAYYAMHTNFDVAKMGSIVAQKLGVSVESPLEITHCQENVARGIGFVGNVSSTTVRDFADSIRENFGLSHVKIFGSGDVQIQKVACCPGSGKSEIDLAIDAGADVYVTGDIDHHSGIDAVARNLVIIDAGHYGLEHIFIKYIMELIETDLPELQVEAEGFKEPFWID